MSKPVFLISCPFDTYSGYGARSRDIVKSIIETEKYDVQLLSQRWGDTPFGFCANEKEWEFLLTHVVAKIEKKPDIWMQITIPNEFQSVGTYNIGCTAGIESTLCASDWIEGLNRMDMNWVSSNHSKEVFNNSKFEKRDKNTNQPIGIIKLEKPVHVVFEGVNLDIYKHLPSKEVKLDLSSIEESFAYLFVGHWMEGDLGHDRKNVGLLVKYFFDTFKNKKIKPALILKTGTGRNSYISRETILERIAKLKKAHTLKTDSLPNIYVLNGSLSDSDMNELYNHPKVKAMVSLTKGEGYGRPLAEFCTSKKPIISSGWSGHTDFISKEFTKVIPGGLEKVHASAANKWLTPESQWFQCNTKETIKALYDVYTNYKKYTDGGKRQAYKIKNEFSYKEMAKLVDKILDVNIPLFPTEAKLVLPNLTTPKL
jgi:hypothetical protein